MRLIIEIGALNFHKKCIQGNLTITLYVCLFVDGFRELHYIYILLFTNIIYLQGLIHKKSLDLVFAVQKQLASTTGRGE